MTLKSRLRPLVRRAVLAYSIRNRHRKARVIAQWMRERGCRDVMFVGTMGEEHAGNPNMANAGIVERVIADGWPVKMGINVTPAVTSYPFTLASACAMPFPDDFVDFALANAVIEHVGGEEEQRQMVEEMTRTARCWVITTPNRWFPVESHTSTVLAHWLPTWRAKRPAREFTRLLSRRELRALLPQGARIEGGLLSPTFTAFYERVPVHEAARSTALT